MTKKLLIAVPHGFCAGVKRAILTLETALEKYGSPIYVNHEIVHNSYLVERFKSKGVHFEVNINEIPENSILMISAHGVSTKFRDRCKKRNFKIIDTTCPLVLKVHNEAMQYAKKGYKILIIGHKKHQEIIGTSGVAKMEIIENKEDIEKIDSKKYKNEKVACLTQTTLSIDYTKGLIEKLEKKIPHLETLSDICFSSQNRQTAVKELCKKCDFVIVIGSKNSSNSNKLVDTAISHGCKAKLFENAQTIPKEIFQYETIGLTSGASVPEELTNQVIEKFKSKNVKIKTIQTSEETSSFPLPKL